LLDVANDIEVQTPGTLDRYHEPERVQYLIEDLLAIPQSDQGNQIKAAGLHISPDNFATV